MQYVCFGYYDKGKFEGMTAAEQLRFFGARPASKGQ